MRTKALLVGSIAYDIVFDVHNCFREEIIVNEGKINEISMMLTAQNKTVFFGGTAGNIAYGLGLLQKKPMLFSVVGGDFKKDYQQHLEALGIDLRVVEKPEEFTATFYAISDRAREQIGIFQPNTHGDHIEKIALKDKITTNELKEVKVAIFSPGTGISIYKHMSEFRKTAGIKPIVIFDPGQILSIFFTPEGIIDCLKLADIFIGNETEIAQLTSILGLKLGDVFKFGIKYVIETKGKAGAVIHFPHKKRKITGTPSQNFIDQTGAGDAFRAGLISGLLEDKSIEESCRIGNLVAARSVEFLGGQLYSL